MLDQLNLTTHVEGEHGASQPALPPGQYRVQLSKWAESETRDRDCRINFSFLVLDGEHKGRLVSESFMAFSGKPDQRSVGFFQRFVKSLIAATGTQNPTGQINSALLNLLVGRPLLMDVAVEPARPDGKGGQYPERNKIGKLHAASSAATAPAAPMMQPQMGMPMQHMQQQAPMAPMQHAPFQSMPQSAPMAPPPGYGAPAPQPYAAPMQAAPAYAPAPMTAAPQAGAPAWMAGAQQ